MSWSWIEAELKNLETERDQKEHNLGQKDAANAGVLERVLHDQSRPLYSDAYNKGYDNVTGFGTSGGGSSGSAKNSGGGGGGGSSGSAKNSGGGGGGGGGPPLPTPPPGVVVVAVAVLVILGLLVYAAVCFFRGTSNTSTPEATQGKIQNSISPAQAHAELLARQRAQSEAEDRQRAKQEAELLARQKAEERAELLALQQAEREEARARQQAERDEARARRQAKEQAERSARTIEYRCPQTSTKKRDAQTARRMGERLNRLEIPWKGDDIYSGGRYQYTVVRYGSRSDWQQKEFHSESEARTWLFAMQLDGFEAHMLSE